jgi:hypothetical protein
MVMLLNLTEDKSNSVAKDAALALINISSSAESAKKWLSHISELKIGNP